MAVAPERDYYAIAEAAVVLEVSTSTVLRWIKSGLLPAYRTGPKHYRVRKEDVAKAVRPAVDRNAGIQNRAEFMPWAFRPITEGLDIPPMTEEEVAQMDAALLAADKVREMIAARRGGKLQGDSADFIRESREERSRQLLP